MANGIYIKVGEEFTFGSLVNLVEEGMKAKIPNSAPARIAFTDEDGEFQITVFPGERKRGAGRKKEEVPEEKPTPKKKSTPRKKTAKKKVQASE